MWLRQLPFRGVRSLIKAAEAGDATLAMCLVNVGEVLDVVERQRGLIAAHRVVALLEQLPLSIVAADRDLTFAAAHVNATRALSCAGTFSVALGQRLAAAVVTGNPEFRSVESLVKVVWLGRS